MEGEKEAEDDKHIQRLYCSITDLPLPIFVDILLKLPVKMILLCRCVSKTCRNQISDPQFAKLHFSGQEACVLLRTLGSKRVSRTLYLVEPETCRNFNLGYCSCYGDYYTHDCIRTCHMKLDTKLKIPLRSEELALNGEVGDAQGSGFKRKRCVKVKPKDQRFKIVNSCHSFLCLAEPTCNDPVVVCNPITGEYINVPRDKRVSEKKKDFVDCGFGFSPRTNQYKVIRIFNEWVHGRKREFFRITEIYTLGTGSWKCIDDGLSSSYKLAFPTYLKGFLHWLCLGFTSSDYIVSFSFDDEQFQSVPPPPLKNHDANWDRLSMMRNVSMGVLEDCLCICEASNYINIWVLKEYGVPESWTKMFSIDTLTDDRWPIGLYQPINYLEEGAVMFYYFTSSLICYDPNGPKFKHLKTFGIRSKFEAIAHIPSFIPLEEAVVGDNVVVLNIYSR
ncbi:F-box protein At3g07870-like [Cornus florida]|uniref:F-box protein At3g07870-like n=1 Tax=Cornus florida TaxID=4283 RepID=UPI00289B0955|nr:F-box protein At3g07870-like [Cornus florida]